MSLQELRPAALINIDFITLFFLDYVQEISEQNIEYCNTVSVSRRTLQIFLFLSLSRLPDNRSPYDFRKTRILRLRNTIVLVSLTIFIPLYNYSFIILKLHVYCHIYCIYKLYINCKYIVYCHINCMYIVIVSC